MIRRRTLAAASAAVLAAPAYVRSQGTINIRMAHSLSTTEPAHLAALFFAKNVGERTNGRVKIEVFPGEQLGSGKDVNEMIRAGANVMNITDPGYLSDFVPDIGALNGPYLIKTPQDYEKLLASPWFKGIEKKLETAGFRLVMANGYFGQRHLIAGKRPQPFGSFRHICFRDVVPRLPHLRKAPVKLAAERADEIHNVGAEHPQILAAAAAVLLAATAEFQHPTDFPVGNQFSDDLDQRAIARLMGQRKFHMRSLAGGDHRVGIVQRPAERLLHIHVNAALGAS